MFRRELSSRSRHFPFFVTTGSDMSTYTGPVLKATEHTAPPSILQRAEQLAKEKQAKQQARIAAAEASRKQAEADAAAVLAAEEKQRAKRLRTEDAATKSATPPDARALLSLALGRQPPASVVATPVHTCTDFAELVNKLLSMEKEAAAGRLVCQEMLSKTFSKLEAMEEKLEKLSRLEEALAENIIHIHDLNEPLPMIKLK